MELTTMVFDYPVKETTKTFCQQLADIVAEADDPKAAAEEFAKKVGTWKDGKWPLVTIRIAHTIHPDEQTRVVTVEGVYSHYTHKCRYSPEVIGLWEISWCVNVIEDSYGKRTHITMDYGK